MSIHVALNHVTRYRYDRPIALGPQVVRLRPAPHCRSRILSYSLRVTPEEHFLNWQQDPEGNYVARLVFPGLATEFAIEVDVVAEMAVINPFDFFVEPAAEKCPFEYDESLSVELAPYLRVAEHGPEFEALVASIDRTPRETNDFLVEINRSLSNRIKYVIRLEPGLQTPEETLELGSGSCRDTSWLLVQLLRRLGLAARFVSGYLVQLVADQKPLDDGPAGPSADFLDLHAWCEVYLPGAGWIGLDPTSGLLAGEGHLPLAATPEPTSAAPVSGLVEKCEATFEHSMTVTRVWEAPRVTKPYSEDEWAAIEALGHAVDEVLVKGDVRLTMGGEPTFVSIDDPDGDEWNTEALGPNKKRLAAGLFHKMRDHYAPTGLAHFGQGKWYPGEPLPRWALNLYWRKDGEPMWSNRALLADESKPSGADPALAARFLQGVAERLGVDAEKVFPAYEDVYYYLWRERKLPSNVDPFDARLDDPLERDRLRRIFQTGLDSVVGHTLPLERLASAWRTGKWHLRGERCYLVPGDSPMGFRLPLDAQPWVAPGDRPVHFPPDPAQPVAPLPSRAALRLQHERRGREKPAATPTADERAPAAFESAKGVVRTAMCAEPRNGVLWVFFPPTVTLDEYVELVTAVEATAEALKTPVLIEGYPPPRDLRLAHLAVTPDPGVIEVNVRPTTSFAEVMADTTFLYEAARESRLTSEKFMLDGRHAGTGGGNHVVLGGATPADSPFLRRPDLLRSLLAYWHQHPSLSFLFSGMFIGPTSQAPRLDEARLDSLFELEIAFRELSRRAPEGTTPPPWMVDRLFRDLLADVTGNTHRTELCIDKLFSPDGPTGRLGLVELRAFEMPPHARMSVVQQVLLRALVARFWEAPYAPERLARWGTELHDRFMLPYFVWTDFEDVISELNAAGYPLSLDWFKPHFEFRFPKYGDLDARGVHVEVRSALEPWHVMAEDAAAGGTARYVDSSLERLQVHVTGLPPDRYVVACNGAALPLAPTGNKGEYIAGVRYRAWQPPRCLHPTIGVHTPLTIDLVDTWMSRSLGGCQYHVAHPGGRAHETRPINAFEAEGRRLARFFRMGHTPGKLEVEKVERNPDFPFTLDLRRLPRGAGESSSVPSPPRLRALQPLSMTSVRLSSAITLTLVACLPIAACGGIVDTSTNATNPYGNAGSSPTGTGGSSAGKAGTSGTGGVPSGTGGVSGKGGASLAGSGGGSGQGGLSGAAGIGGAAGIAGSGTAGSGIAGSGTAGSGTAGSGVAGSGVAGSGIAGSGTAGSGGTFGFGGAGDFGGGSGAAGIGGSAAGAGGSDAGSGGSDGGSGGSTAGSGGTDGGSGGSDAGSGGSDGGSAGTAGTGGSGGAPPTCMGPGQSTCGDETTCFDLQTDDAHCGDCNTACGANQQCVAALCVTQPVLGIAVPIPKSAGCLMDWSQANRRVAVDDANDIYVGLLCGGVPMVSVSIDGGASFSTPTAIIGLSSPQAQFSLEGGAPGVVYAAWVDATTRFARSADVGGSWAIQTLVGPVSPAFGLGLTRYANRVYVATSDGGGGTGLTVWRGDDAASITFASKTVLTQTDPFDVLASPMNGDVWAVTDTTPFHLAKSIDGGGSFGPELVETTNANASTYTDWVFAKDRIVVAGDSTDGSIVDPAAPLPRKPFTIELAESRTRSITTDSAGNATWVYVSGTTIRSGRLPAGATIADAPKTIDASGTSPHARVDRTNKALIVAYVKAGAVVVSLVANLSTALEPSSRYCRAPFRRRPVSSLRIRASSGAGTSSAPRTASRARTGAPFWPSSTASPPTPATVAPGSSATRSKATASPTTSTRTRRARAAPGSSTSFP